ncbi:hypothetical protein CVT26_003159 [Gymnopilus dilepis]|uniref:Major facilitator superfamily (MFS) profile domain-containing protein n=1 Tax=Gymnopilus dilepis TaxID=231916 RepID=A0A409X176_9AGAR|nr:hypothetical protein CVT26_003159 [Gymnopilus dilepis]
MQYIPGFAIGRAFDAGYFHYMVVLGTFLQITSMFMLSLARPHKYFEVHSIHLISLEWKGRLTVMPQAVGMGLGQSLLFLPSLTIIGHHFRRRRALATGIAVSGASFGGMIWPILLNQLSQRISFPNAIRTTAAICGLMLVVSNLLMKTRSMAGARFSGRPNVRLILQDSAYLVSVASAFCINLGLFFPSYLPVYIRRLVKIADFYLQLYAVNRHIKDELAFYSLTILNAGSTLGRLLPNFFADRFGTYNLLLPCLFISSGLVFTMFAISNLQTMVNYADISLIPSLLAQLSNDAMEHGHGVLLVLKFQLTRMGIAFSVVGVSMLIGTPIEGSLLTQRDHDYTWSRSIVFCGVSPINCTSKRDVECQIDTASVRGRRDDNI